MSFLELQPLLRADHAAICRFAAALPRACLELGGNGVIRQPAAILSTAGRVFRFERRGGVLRLREVGGPRRAEAGTAEAVLAVLSTWLAALGGTAGAEAARAAPSGWKQRPTAALTGDARAGSPGQMHPPKAHPDWPFTGLINF